MKQTIKIFYSIFKKKISALNIIILTITIIFNAGCNAWKYHIPQYLDIEQGIYLTQQDIKKISLGMSKTEIFLKIGFPILKNFFGLNKWYYVYCHYNIKGELEYKTIELEFNLDDILILINIL